MIMGDVRHVPLRSGIRNFDEDGSPEEQLAWRIDIIEAHVPATHLEAEAILCNGQVELKNDKYETNQQEYDLSTITLGC